MSKRTAGPVVVFLIAVLWAAFAAGPAVGASHVYSAAWNAATLNEFTVGPGGALSSLGTVPAGDTQPWYIAMTPNAGHLYVTTFSGKDVVAFDVGSDGQLAAKDPADGGVAATGTAPVGIAVSPDGRNAYVANKGSASVSLYDLSPDGAITPKSVPTEFSGSGAYSVAVSPEGDSVYVANSNVDTVSQFDREADGSLTPKTPPTVPVTKVNGSAGPSYIVLTPDGKHLYTANYNDPSIGVFDVGAEGRLTEKAGSPVVAPDSMNLLALSPDGHSLYSPDVFDGAVSQFDIGADGGLTPKSPPSQAGGQSLDGMWITPDGKNAYVSNYGTYVNTTQNKDYFLAQFALGGNGLLSPLSPPALSTDDYPAGVIVTPDQGPAASFSASPAGAGAPTAFDASASSDPDDSVARYVWDFGDGTPAADGNAQASHAYPANGTYEVRLTVFDNAGCSTGQVYTGQTPYCNGGPAATTTRTVTVGDTAATPTGTTPATPATPPSGPQCADRLAPLTKLKRAGLRGVGGLRLAARAGLTLSGTATDRGAPCASGVQRVQVSLARVKGRTGKNCRFIKAANRYELTRPQNCRRPVLFTAKGTQRWSFAFPIDLKPGLYRVQARGVDTAKNKETPNKQRNIVFFSVR
jgi:6-phosphogluconolactonase (cycloisomerase 2 family)